MKKILLTVFIAVTVLITAAAVYYVSAPVNTQELTQETVKNSITASKAYIIRDEEVYYADSSGTVYNNVRDGERIAANTLLATIYHTDIATDALTALRTVDKKIQEQTKKEQEFTDHRFDKTDTENKIAAIIQDIPSSARSNNITRIAEYKELINNLRSGTEISEEDKLAGLYEEKNNIEQSINSEKSEIRSSISGLFTTYIDGLEEFLKDNDINNYTIEYINSLPKITNERLTSLSVINGNPICKVVNNHVWYLALPVQSEKIADYDIGTNVTLNLDDIGITNARGTVCSISEADENGQKLAVIKCSTYIEGAFSYRASNAELIFESYTGYKVPTHSIRTDKDGKKYVLCRSGSKEYVCFCNIDYTNTDEEFVIINSAEDSENKLEKMDRIIIGER